MTTAKLPSWNASEPQGPWTPPGWWTGPLALSFAIGCPIVAGLLLWFFGIEAIVRLASSREPDPFTATDLFAILCGFLLVLTLSFRFGLSVARFLGHYR